MKVVAVVGAALSVALVPYGSIPLANQVTEREVREAMAWARAGDVQPYALLSLPDIQGRRAPRGRVYTQRVRLAMLAESTWKQGRDLRAEEVPLHVAQPSVLIAWDWKPDFIDTEVRGCGRFADAPTSVLVRLRSDNSAPPEIQPTAVYMDEQGIRQVMSPFETNTDSIWFVAELPQDALRPDSLLVWRTTSMVCPSGSTHSAETWALISRADLQRWR